jgi:hypothetical protein
MLISVVFEDEALADKATMATEKAIHQGGDDHVEHVSEKGPIATEITPKNVV